MKLDLTPFEEHPEGTLLHVKALAAARRNELQGVENGQLKVATTAVPEKGQANEAILRQLAAHLGLPRRDCCETGPDPVFLEGIVPG